MCEGSDKRSSILLPLLLLLSLCSGCINLDLAGSGRSELVETIIRGDKGPKILLLDIDGEITSAGRLGMLGFLTQESTVARVRDQLEYARERDDVAALLVRLDSPGGSVTASDLVHYEISRFKRESAVPVVAQLMNLATSGAYYIAAASDEIVANQTTVTGSIGVVFLGLNLSGLMEKLGVEDQTFTSGPFKDTGSMLRPMSPEEEAQLQSVIDRFYQRFVQVVDAGRPALSTEQVRQLADGRIFSADQALEAGLVDRLGTLDQSVARIRDRLAADEVRVVYYHRRREWRSNLYSANAPRADFEIKSAAAALLMPRPGFHYLWWPGVR